LQVHLLNRSIPPQILNEFRQQLQQSARDANLNFTPEPQLQALFTLLQTWQQQAQASDRLGAGERRSSGGAADIADLVTLGDGWLTQAVRQRLIQPLEPNQLQNWSQLPQTADWQSLVRRNTQGQPDPNGQVWAAPYRWGTTVIAYRQDIFQQRGLTPPTDWNDLWRSDLSRRISLLNQPREVIGLTLKKLGRSYNTADLSRVPGLETELRGLQQQVKLYSSDAYLQPLMLGDTWVAVGWSTDVLPLMQRSRQIAAVVPRSGTALWADLWVRPTTAPIASLALAQEWINFCWQAPISQQLSLLSWAASPMLLTTNSAELPAALREQPVLLPAADILANSEFLQPLSDAAINQYRSIWLRLRQTG
jgi:putative spermidine/putrescine transport system substrate-binding protein